VRRHVFAIALVACTRTPTPTPTLTPTPTQTPTPTHVEDLSAALEPIRAKGNVPALAAAAFRGNELLAIGATGVRRKGHDERVTADDRWHLGSDTKAMTAMLVAMQIDKGTMRFEDTLGAIFGAGVNEKLRGVTIEQLLQHRAGFAANPSGELMMDMWKEGEDAAARARWVGKLLAEAPAHAPGTFEYSNSSYIVLGAALEHVTKRSWEDSMRADLFGPLAMSSCGFGAPPDPAPWGHRKIGEELVTVAPGPLADNAPILGPAGRVHCTLRDWGKFLAVVLAGLRGERGATMKRLYTPPEIDEHRYAGGWMFMERPWAGGVVATHSGSNTMWVVTAWLAPAKNLAFVSASNVFDPKTADAAFSTMIPKYAEIAKP